MQEDQKNKVLIITGPTGIGKTSLSFPIQKMMHCSIISADSRQVYKEMSIGTAKPDPEEIEQYNIQLCDYVSVKENYNVGRFVSDALMVLDHDFKEHGHSIVCGGTGMYIKALTEGLHSFPDIPEELIHKWELIYQEDGLTQLQDHLRSKDPEYFQKVDLNNPHRLLRAISVIEHTGKSFSSFLKQEKEKRNFELSYIVLDMPRDILYKRIEDRVDRMMDVGLLEEVRSLYGSKELKALNTVAYVELFDHLDGKISLEEAIDLIKTHSRQYAKRQLTWFRKFMPMHRFHPFDEQVILDHVRLEFGLD